MSVSETEGGAAASTPSRGSRLAIGVLVALCFLAVLPLVLLSPPLYGHDSSAHIRWQFHVAQALWSGTLYPRWLPDAAAGFGSPAFFFYPPLGHWMTALVSPLLPGEEWPRLGLALSMGASLAIGSGCLWAWLRSFGLSREAAFFGALIFLIAPYHVMGQIYWRSAFGEAWVLAWLPCLLLGLRRVDSPRGFVTVTLATAALVLSNVPGFLCTIPVIGIFTLHLWIERRSLRPVLYAAGAGLLACGLCGAYLGTALTQTDFIRTASLLNVPPERWLIGAPNPPADDTAAILTVIVLATVGVAALLLLPSLALLKGPRPQALLLRTVAVTAILTTVAMLPLSAPLWTGIEQLRVIQFPWRFLLVSTLCLGAISALAVDGLKRIGMFAILRAAQLVTVAASVGAALFLGNVNFKTSAPVQARLATSSAEFVSRGLEVPEYTLGNLDESRAMFPDGVRVQVLSGAGTATVEQWDSRRIALQTDSTEPLRIAVRQFLYTGWSYTVDDAAQRLEATAFSPAVPVVTLEVPAGRHRVALRQDAMSGEYVGAILSLLSLLALAGVVTAMHRHRRPQNAPAPLASPAPPVL